MSDQPAGAAAPRASLPESPNLDWLRKQARRRLAELRRSKPTAKLADAQFAIATEYGFPSWRALKAHVDSLSVDGQLFDAARRGDVETLERVLAAHPDKLHARSRPYEHTLLHAAAHAGQLATVDALLARGLDPNAREKGDNTYPMHWAAAAGALDVVRRLADAGGDVIGTGDDHELEVIGWATCWDGGDDDQHRAIADFLVSRGARHHIFSAIATDQPDEVRRIVANDPAQLERRMSRNENHQRPLHFAVRMHRPRMIALLLELGADPLGRDGAGYPAAVYAESHDVDRAILESIAESGRMDPLTAVALGDWAEAERQLRSRGPDSARDGVLHLMAKRGNTVAVEWLLAHGLDPNERWTHWDSDVTPLHMAVLGGSPEVVRLLLAAGADPTIRDTKHDSDALGWAEFFERVEIVRMLRSG